MICCSAGGAPRGGDRDSGVGGRHEPPAPVGDSSLRIACLLPSATEIVGALGLAGSIVAMTHECDLCPDAAGLGALLASGSPPPRVTSTTINPHAMSQGAIDDAVKRSVASGISLYAVDQASLLAAAPTLVLTQALCAVCAPATSEVDAVCRDIASQLESQLGVAGAAVEVLSLQPSDLPTVAESFETVASACGPAHAAAGRALRSQFERQLAAVGAAVSEAASSQQPPPSVLLLEWLDPVFDAGHWVPGQLEAAGCRVARLGDVREKSTERDWAAVVAADPDCVLVGCCGFDAARNRIDAEALLAGSSAAAASFRSLRAVREGES